MVCHSVEKHRKKYVREMIGPANSRNLGMQLISINVNATTPKFGKKSSHFVCENLRMDSGLYLVVSGMSTYHSSLGHVIQCVRKFFPSRLVVLYERFMNNKFIGEKYFESFQFSQLTATDKRKKNPIQNIIIQQMCIFDTTKRWI